MFTDNLLYECTLCKAKSGRKDNVRRHVRNLHSDSGEKLETILTKIFNNFTKKQSQSTKKTENKSNRTEIPNDDNVNCVENLTGLQSEQIDSTKVTDLDVTIDESPKVLRNIATSVIKFAARVQQTNDCCIQDKPNIISAPTISITLTEENDIDRRIENSKIEQPTVRVTDSNPAVDMNLEIGVDLPSLNYEPLTYDPFPKFAPLPLLNTNTNLSVYRQLLSPYLRKTTALSNANANPVDPVESNSQPTATRNETQTKTPVKVIDRPPKKMIDKYDFYRD